MRPAATFAGYADLHRDAKLIFAGREGLIDRPMRDDRTEILIGADKFQIFDDLIAQLRNLQSDAAILQSSRQSTQYHSRSDIDDRHAGKIEHDNPELGWGRIDHMKDLTADMLRIEVEP